MAEDSHHQDTVQSLQYEIELLKTRISQEREKLKVTFVLKLKDQLKLITVNQTQRSSVDKEQR